MEVHFNMSKLTREQKIEIYARRKNGETVSSLIKEFKIRSEAVNYIVSLIDLHGFDILRTDKNNYYSIMMKQEIIDKVLIDNRSIRSVALEYGLLSRGMLQGYFIEVVRKITFLSGRYSQEGHRYNRYPNS